MQYHVFNMNTSWWNKHLLMIDNCNIKGSTLYLVQTLCQVEVALEEEFYYCGQVSNQNQLLPKLEGGTAMLLSIGMPGSELSSHGEKMPLNLVEGLPV